MHVVHVVRAGSSSPTMVQSPLIDPRKGDFEDDSSSTTQRSMLSLLGSLLVEISLPKLVLAWFTSVAIPALLLGLAPVAISVWLRTASRTVLTPLYAVVPTLLVLLGLAVAWFGRRPLLRLAERSFWSLHSVLVQPIYALAREGLRHVGYRFLSARSATAARLATLLAGLLVCAVAAVLVMVAWPATHWRGTLHEIATPRTIAVVAIANGCVLILAYLAVAAMIWSVADAMMPQPHDLAAFDAPSDGGRIWRVAHLSDVHVVGRRYGFRIESGRAGPRGNDRFRRVLAMLDALDSTEPLEAVLITGDMTDAGDSSEWSEFLDALADHPRLARRVLVVPGNHDVNIVDRANPARFELPTSPTKRLRQLRLLSAMSAIQGERVRTVDETNRRVGDTLAEVLQRHRSTITTFADAGRPSAIRELEELLATVFPMVWLPDPGDGLGILLLNSNAETNFSFTNALGMMPTDQVTRIQIAMQEYPSVRWVLAMHHHVVEYPQAAHTLSERVGTALINGHSFLRRLRSQSPRLVVMHGHRHVDWIGQWGQLLIVSAPSPVMGVTDDLPSAFYIHSLTAGRSGSIALLPPQRITIPGDPEPSS